ncbi:hypothetical protein L6452_01747 [Arctium lappa]|uniref:Uncharacterized protein n=1 Tax=Arctium lappa TaxID=4217 RepID=A0ACB9FJ02_ARCLA|nr:hypothetical protein L6452_01747 [Arctium lappa]
MMVETMAIQSQLLRLQGIVKELFIRLTGQDEPIDIKEALASTHSSKWLGSIRATGCKLVFKVKDDNRYKARLVAKGYAQRKGIEYVGSQI